MCQEVIYRKGESFFIKTAVGHVESLEPGTLTLLTEHLWQDLSSINKGIISFDSNGKLRIFEIIGISQIEDKSITFLVSPQET
jgi:hypothetical protein